MGLARGSKANQQDSIDNNMGTRFERYTSTHGKSYSNHKSKVNVYSAISTLLGASIDKLAKLRGSTANLQVIDI